eukprot:764979-Hanusia_phi.AAC.1
MPHRFEVLLPRLVLPACDDAGGQLPPVPVPVRVHAVPSAGGCLPVRAAAAPGVQPAAERDAPVADGGQDLPHRAVPAAGMGVLHGAAGMACACGPLPGGAPGGADVRARGVGDDHVPAGDEPAVPRRRCGGAGQLRRAARRRAARARVLRTARKGAPQGPRAGRLHPGVRRRRRGRAQRRRKGRGGGYGLACGGECRQACKSCCPRASRAQDSDEVCKPVLARAIDVPAAQLLHVLHMLRMGLARVACRGDTHVAQALEVCVVEVLGHNLFRLLVLDEPGHGVLVLLGKDDDIRRIDQQGLKHVALHVVYSPFKYCLATYLASALFCFAFALFVVPPFPSPPRTYFRITLY